MLHVRVFIRARLGRTNFVVRVGSSTAPSWRRRRAGARRVPTTAPVAAAVLVRVVASASGRRGGTERPLLGVGCRSSTVAPPVASSTSSPARRGWRWRRRIVAPAATRRLLIWIVIIVVVAFSTASLRSTSARHGTSCLRSRVSLYNIANCLQALCSVRLHVLDSRSLHPAAVFVLHLSGWYICRDIPFGSPWLRRCVMP